MSFWLFKSEPNVISFQSLMDKLPADEEWHGIRNYQARNNMRLMQVGERGFFYHSNIGKEIVGIARISVPGIVDPTDPEGKWAAVKVKPVAKLVSPVTLKTIKETPELAAMELLRLSRLSVSGVRHDEWALICDMAGGTI